jgi:3-(3-hydroxy-phenyl)propionate hydroxylase
VQQPAGAVLLDDVLPFGFLIVATSADALAGMKPAARAAWRRLRGERAVLHPPDRADGALGDGVRELIETDGLFTAWAKSHGCTAAVVRPDRYVFGLARDVAELNRLVADVHCQVFGSDAPAQVAREQANW